MSDSESAKAALDVMAAHLRALNARDNEALAATLHFPHYRLASGTLQVWADKASYLDDFRARAGQRWQRSEWDACEVLHASEDKVHIDVTFTRFDASGSVLGSYRSLWVITRIDGRWAAQLRSSFAD